MWQALKGSQTLQQEFRSCFTIVFLSFYYLLLGKKLLEIASFFLLKIKKVDRLTAS